MKPILHPIFALWASATREELARQIAYLKEENRILRARLPQRLTVHADIDLHCHPAPKHRPDSLDSMNDR